MKPTSIIFLVVSIVLVIIGFSLAGAAQGMAAAEGIELLSQTSEDTGTYIYTYEYDADNIGKITINIKDAKVNIIGGAAKPYVELLNFAEGMYEFSSSNRNLMISNNSDFSSFTGLAAVAMNFKGLRSLINYYNISGMEKTVNIYLCDENPVNVIDCRLDAGEVAIRDSNTATDYNVEIGAGNLTVDGVTTSSAINVTIDTGNADISDSAFASGSIAITTGSVSADAIFKQLTVKIETGDFSYAAENGIGVYNLKLTTNVGKIVSDGEELGGFYERLDLPTYDKLDIDIGVGDITLSTVKAES